MPLCTRWILGGLPAVFCCIATAARPENPLKRMVPVERTEPIPVVDFFRPSQFSNPELNPAGTHFFASTTTDVDRREIVVCDIATRKFQGLYAPGNKDIADINWLGDDRLIFNVVSENRYSEGLYVVPIANLRKAYGVDYKNADHVLGAPPDAPYEPLVWIRHSAFDRGRDAGVVQIDALTPRGDPFHPASNIAMDPRSVEHGTLAKVVRSYPQLKHGRTRGYRTDLQGRLVYGLTTDEGRTFLHRLDGSEWRRCPVDLDEVEIVSVAEQAGTLLVLGPRREGAPRALHRLDTETGRLGEIVYQDDKYDLARCRPYLHPVDGRVLGIRFEQEFPATHWFDPAYERLQKKIENTLGRSVGNATVSIVGSDRAEKRYFVAVRSDRRPGSYLMIDIEKGAITTIVDNVAPWLDPERLCPMSFLSFKNRDGIPIDGYLTLPPGTSKEAPAPLVVLPHGGPWVRDSWGYDPEVQFLASRGYAVFQPNYRGSLGTQWRFPLEDLWAFRKMHDDVTDGVARLAETGLIDRDRIAIMGGSFGAYLAVSGVAHEPGLYRCAVAMSGVYDWEAMISEARRFESDGVSPGRTAVLRRFLGDPKTQGEKFDEISPVRFVSQIRVPVFVAHGSVDRVTSIEQSKRLIAAFKENSVAHETFLQRNEGHGMADLEHRVNLYTAIEAFLEKHLAPRAGRPPSTPPGAGTGS